MSDFGLSNAQVIEMAPAAGATKPAYGASDLYSFVPTYEAIDLLRESGWFPQSAKQADTRLQENNGYQRHKIRFAMPMLDGSDERVELTMYNSHDRGSAFRLYATIFRKICENGLMTSSDVFSFSHKHMNFDADKFLSSAKFIADNAGSIGRAVIEMKAIELSQAERLIFADIAHDYVWGSAKLPPVEANQLLTERRYDDNGKDLWSTYNVIQENLMKGGLSGFRNNRHGHKTRIRTRPVASLDREVKLNKALWSMAEKMAELKDSPIETPGKVHF